ncbi:hypothetical protein P153DRAFT_394054 [Dothidotthia symphoricarpi CBS 119687]|uniref:Uncharacterized protein n=1 Tax=Dothidotthia symphoricarpi CBS 119687 TaxID=1392245 RepID=A0A6A6ALQ1_9PLEO|nr:uncharacterized protein P153DRAFT_394054 [Dothidotthia symphoricarpi CBS 119687]KAF2131864.1 hypothetical protein P153DRAFT_394054 [Dothidotthia symphoricarpi CBS 119687]
MAAADDSTPRTLRYTPIAYGSFDPTSAARIDSATESPIKQPRPGYKYANSHRIIPPSIKGHGRLIVAHRTVPYWGGILIVLGAFVWAVLCAIFLYPLLSGHPITRRPDHEHRHGRWGRD